MANRAKTWKARKLLKEYQKTERAKNKISRLKSCIEQTGKEIEMSGKYPRDKTKYIYHFDGSLRRV